MSENKRHRLAKKIAVKSAELLENFQWSDYEADVDKAKTDLIELEVLIESLNEELKQR